MRPEDLTNRFDGKLDVGDLAIVERLVGVMLKDDTVVQAAKSGSSGTFPVALENALKDELLRMHTTSRKLFERFFADKQFRVAVQEAMGAEFRRRHGG